MSQTKPFFIPQKEFDLINQMNEELIDEIVGQSVDIYKVNVERTEQALETQPEIIAAACPFCNTMMTDGVKNFEKEGEVAVMDVAEMIANAQDL